MIVCQSFSILSTGFIRFIGSCNRNQSDDIYISTSATSSKYTNPLQNWQTTDIVETELSCVPKKPVVLKNCTLPSNNVCALLTDDKIFGKVRKFLD